VPSDQLLKVRPVKTSIEGHGTITRCQYIGDLIVVDRPPCQILIGEAGQFGDFGRKWMARVYQSTPDGLYRDDAASIVHLHDRHAQFDYLVPIDR
jgi:hypothetical protein